MKSDKRPLPLDSAVSRTRFPATRTTWFARLLPLLVLLTLPAVVQAQYIYTTNSGTITITVYTGPGGAVTIPDTINGMPVTRIGQQAFDNYTSLTSVTIPNSVTTIGAGAFADCFNLTRVTIGNSVSSIGLVAFSECHSLTCVTIPDGVTSIKGGTFESCLSLVQVTIGKSVTNFADYVFSNCESLTGVYFKGNAPSVGSSVFDGADNATVYYLPGATGWGATFGGRPTELWKPVAQTSNASFGMRTNQFGFNIAWASGQVVVVEACTSLANPVWSPLQTNTLTSDSLYFSDPQWTNDPARFYRVRSP